MDVDKGKLLYGGYTFTEFERIVPA